MKKEPILIGLLLANAVLWGFFNPWHAPLPSAVNTDKVEVAPKETPLQQNLTKIREYIESQPFHSEEKRIDFIRNFVYQNSIHKIDYEHKKYAFDTTRVLSMLWENHQTSTGQPHLSCGPRALAMKAILCDLRIPNRMIMIFTDNYSELRAHIFLEVFNWETRNWELQDPDFNIYYIDIHNRKRLPTDRLIWRDLDSVIPISPVKKGWKKNNVAHLKRDYFEAMVYMDQSDEGKTVLLINPNRFSINKVFEKNGNTSFYEFVKKRYLNPVLIMSEDSDKKWSSNIEGGKEITFVKPIRN